MNRLIQIAVLFICCGTALADSGGPYVGVPDLKASETPPVFAIPRETKPLRFFLTHIPKLHWNDRFGEPDAYTWQPCIGYYASFEKIAYNTLCIRYISDARIDEGLDYADVLMILAFNEINHEYSPRFYTSGGVVFDHRAVFHSGSKAEYIVVTRFYSGNACMQDKIYLDLNRGVRRFMPRSHRK